MGRYAWMMVVTMLGAAVLTMAMPTTAQQGARDAAQQVVEEATGQPDSESAQADDIKVEPVALQTVSQALAQHRQELMTNLEPGTMVSVFLRSSGEKRIVSIDDRNSQVETFTDAQGNDLMKAPEDQEQSNQFGGFNDNGVGPFPKIADGGKLALVELSAPRVPASGAGNVAVQGTVVINVAAGTKTETVTDVELATGKLSVPDKEIEISKVGASQWDESKFSVQFKTDAGTLDQIAAIKFIDSEGNEIKSRQSGSMTMMNTANVTYILDKKVDAATIEFEFYDQMEEIQVPLDLEVSMGL